MAKDLAAVQEKINVADIVHHGEKITLPENMNINDAIECLQRRAKYLQEEVNIGRKFNVFPWDGANAFSNVLTKRYGWVSAEPIPGFFGDTPPQMIGIEIAPGQTRQVPWGRFSLPDIDGHLECEVGSNNGIICFYLSASVRRASEDVVKTIFDAVEQEVKLNSIYMGKAIRMRFRNDEGSKLKMPTISFIDVSSITREMVIYSKSVQDSVETNLFTPIERAKDCVANQIPIKRGVLLGGPYGTGKTLAATVASRLAVDNGVTYLYVPRADELADALLFAKQYQENACVIFCEDIDRAVSGERRVEMDDILNILDGIDSKDSRIITVLTTNHIENINPAMLRPGRLDAIIEVTPPDAAAAEKLLRYYGKETIPANEDLSEAGKVLDGAIPAVIAEVVKRAKLVQLRLQPRNTKVEGITAAAVLEAANTMRNQVELLERSRKPKQSPATFNEVMGGALLHALNGTKEQINDTSKKVSEIHARIQ